MYSMNLGPLSYRVLMSFTTYARGLLEKRVIWGMVLYTIVCQNDMLFKPVSYQLLRMKS